MEKIIVINALFYKWPIKKNRIKYFYIFLTIFLIIKKKAIIKKNFFKKSHIIYDGNNLQ